MKQKVFIFITNTDWNSEAPRCRHQLAYEYAKVGKVLFFQKRGASLHLDDNIDGLELHHLPFQVLSRRLVLLLPFLWVIRNLIYSFFFKRLVRKYDGDDIYVFNFLYDLNLNIPYSYICNDEFTNYHPWPFSSLFNLYERRNTAKAQNAFAVSAPLYRKLKKYNESVHRFRTGVGHIVSRNSGPPEFKENQKINLGHGGHINGRLEFSVFKELAKSREFTVEVFGPVNGAGTEEELVDFKNDGGQVSEEKRGKEFFEYLEKFDALIIPYRLIPETLAISSPNKLLFYLQTGRPVIMTDLPDLDDEFRDVVQVVSEKGNWKDSVLEAISKDSILSRQRRIALAQKYTWESSATSILETIEQERRS